MTDWQAIGAAITAHTGAHVAVDTQRSVSGGCINQAVVLGEPSQQVFVKLNSVAQVEMFAAEFEGLQAIAGTDAIRVPQSICHGVAGNHSYLVTEYIEIGRARTDSAAEFGEQLAAMHISDVGQQFGWRRDNTIGSTPQINTWENDWITFWREQRLGFQLELAAQNGAGARCQDLGVRLQDALPALLGGLSVKPSCLHGDLWSGNWGFDQAGAPVIFDPAVYFGDRETDLAMTELFGSPGHEFFAAYRAVYPLEAGYSTRKTLYNLYHILNHFNLFGGGYLAQAERMMQQLLSEVSG